ncbi:MAG: hypothetical protein ABI150_04865 [Nitrobacter sp.]
MLCDAGPKREMLTSHIGSPIHRTARALLKWTMREQIDVAIARAKLHNQPIGAGTHFLRRPAARAAITENIPARLALANARLTIEQQRNALRKRLAESCGAIDPCHPPDRQSV